MQVEQRTHETQDSMFGNQFKLSFMNNTWKYKRGVDLINAMNEMYKENTKKKSNKKQNISVLSYYIYSM